MKVDEFTIDFPCPECQLHFPVSLHQMAEGGIIVCPRCRATNAETELREIENNLNELGKSLQNLKQFLQEKTNLSHQQ